MMKRILPAHIRLAATGALLRACRVRALRRAGRPGGRRRAELPGDHRAPCVAAVRMTGYQGRASGGPKNPYYIRRDGYLSRSRSAREAHPRGDQVLPRQLRHSVQARISVLRKGDHAQDATRPPADRPVGHLRARPVLRLKPDVRVRKPMPVKKGNWIAITVPTWAPMFATTLAGRTGGARRARRTAASRPRAYNQFAHGGSAQGRTSSAAPTTARACSTRSPTCRRNHVRIRPVSQKGLPPAALALASTRDHRGVDLHGRLPGLRRRTADRVADLVLPAARRRGRLSRRRWRWGRGPGSAAGQGRPWRRRHQASAGPLAPRPRPRPLPRRARAPTRRRGAEPTVPRPLPSRVRRPRSPVPTHQS